MGGPVELFEHEARHGQLNHHFAATGQDVVIFGQTVVLAQPSKRTFDNPVARQDFNTARISQADLQLNNCRSFTLLSCRSFPMLALSVV
jgi:hypothetical protein